MAIKKRLPVDEEWGKDAFCKGKDPLVWDTDSPEEIWIRGRRQCIRDCIVREACLRKALQSGDTLSVVRGGIVFDKEQYDKKKSDCLFCGYPVATLKLDENKQKVKSQCWVCHRYTPCLAKCGRMVKRRPRIGTYYCKYCSRK